MSIRFAGTLYRWHEPKRFWSGEDFWRTFQDGPWKWDSQQRFAGQDINSGHYFALSSEGAEAEVRSYRIDFSRHRLLEVELSLESILDLTHEHNIRRFGVDGPIKNPEVFGDDFFMGMLSQLLARILNGNKLTDYIGY
jgi:hypothetical protein